MVVVEGAVPGGQRFDAAVKCCTYMPELPNYLVGLALQDTSAEMEAGCGSLRARIGRAVAVTPLGLLSPRLSVPAYRSLAAEGFGLARGLKCPHFVDGGCGIWRYRNAVCSTWFCRFEAGARGARFWAALRWTLERIEQSLAWHAALEVGLDARAIFALQAATDAPERVRLEELGGPPDMDRLASWGHWLGREEEFYTRCASVVSRMSWDEVRTVGGPPLRAALQMLEQAEAELRVPPLPARIATGDTRVAVHGTDHVILLGFRAADPLRLPRALYDNLHHLVGPSADALDRFHAATGRRLDADTLQMLLDVGVLVGVG